MGTYCPALVIGHPQHHVIISQNLPACVIQDKIADRYRYDGGDSQTAKASLVAEIDGVAEADELTT